MPSLLPTKTYTVSTGGTVNIALTGSSKRYVFDGTPTLSSGYTISPSGTAQEGMVVEIVWLAKVSLNSNNVTLFGFTLTSDQVANDGLFVLYFDGSAWNLVWQPDLTGSLPFPSVEIQTLTAGGGTINLDPAVNSPIQIITGSPTLSSSWTIQTSGTLVNGKGFTAIYKATPTVSGNNVTIFGDTLTDDQAESGSVRVETVYDGSSYQTNTLQDFSDTSFIETAMIKNEAVTKDKLEDVTYGSILIGNVSDRPVELDIKTADSLVGGNGTTGLSLTQDTGNSNVTFAESGGNFTLNVNSGTNTLELYDENPATPTANTVSGDNAVAIGEGNTASGNNSVALGDTNTTGGVASFSAGDSNGANGDAATSLGNNNQASGNYSLAAGQTNVASGQQSVALGAVNTATQLGAVAIGRENDVTGASGSALGATNAVSGIGAVAIGTVNTASGDGAVAIGNNNNAQGVNSIALSENSNTTRTSQISSASGRHGGTSTFSQSTTLNPFRSTTDATNTELTLTGASPAAGTRVTVAENSLMQCHLRVCAVQQGGSAGTAGDSATWDIKFAIKNIGGTTALLGDPVYYTDAGTASTSTQTWAEDVAVSGNWTVTITADNTNDSIAITVSGEANKTIYWGGSLQCQEIKYA